MSQRFRRNFAPVLGALLLLALGVGLWALLGAQRTRDATAALHAEFGTGVSPWAFALPPEGYAVFVYRAGERVCATVSLQPEMAVLVEPSGQPQSVARGDAESLLARAATLAAQCDRLEVRVFASRMPYHGRFEIRYADAAVSTRSEPVFGH